MFPQPTNSNRLTYPTGTKIPDPFQTPQINPFSNPSTAANGALGAGGGANNLPAPQIGAQIGTPGAFASGGDPFGDWLKKIFTFTPNPGRATQGGGNMSLATNPGRNVQGGGTGTINNVATSAFNQATKSTFSAQSAVPSNVPNSMVGNDIGANPTSINEQTAAAMFQGWSQSDISQTLAARGYSYVPPSAANDYQGHWLQTGNPQGSGNMLESKAGIYFDPGQLNRFEKVKGANGNIYRGGAPVTKDLSTGVNGTPAGTGQYSVTLQQNLNKKLEAKGAYKWQSTLTRDANGNWVRTYKKVLRGGYTRAGHQRRENQAALRHQGQVDHQTQDQGLQQNFNQLVTIRANYG